MRLAVLPWGVFNCRSIGTISLYSNIGEKIWDSVSTQVNKIYNKVLLFFCVDICTYCAFKPKYYVVNVVSLHPPTKIRASEMNSRADNLRCVHAVVSLAYLSLAWICMHLVERGVTWWGIRGCLSLAKSTAVLPAVLIASPSLALIYLHFFPITPN